MSGKTVIGMLKKIISITMGLCLALASFTAPAAAENTSEKTFSKTAPLISYETKSNGYAEYCEKYKDYSAAGNDIVLSGAKPFKLSGGASAEKDGTVLSAKGQSVSFEITVRSDAWYQPEITYYSLPGNGSDIELSLTVDGKLPYYQADNFLLYRLWKNKTNKISTDDEGNEYSPEQIEAYEMQTACVRDSDGFVTDSLCLALNRGKHIITLTAGGEPVKIASLKLSSPDVLPTYKEYLSRYKSQNKSNYDGEPIVIQGENAAIKSQKMFIPLACKNDAVVTPSDPTHTKMNYIGGSNWSKLGGAITWQIPVEKDGFYKLSFHFRQNYLQEGSSYRTLSIDGKVPFAEAQAIAFPYKSNWQNMIWQENGEDVLVYLEKGTHNFTLTVTLGNLSDFSSRLQDVTNKIGRIYRQIVRITGESPDANRDYALFESIPELEKNLTDINDKLDELSKMSDEVLGSSGGSNTQMVRKVSVTIEQMLKKKYQAQTKLSAFYDNYSSLCSWLYEMQNMALDIDSFALVNPDEDYKGATVGFFESIGFSLRRLFSTFGNNSESKVDENTIVLWSNWGRDQLNVLESLIANDFTPKTGIKVKIKITAASLVQAGLSGNGPDVEINLARTDPLNYAMRGILTDLSQFDDYDEVIGRFSKTASVPYEYNGGVYGLPNTETYNMLFIRTDIFEELGLTPPKTWDEFINCAKVISLNNMDSGMPADALYMFMLQNGADLYTPDHSATTLTEPKTVESAQYWLDFYTKYSFPVTYNLFNRFRTGLMPMAIAPYTEYATLKAAAPEINGKWTMVQVPGFMQEDGTINNTVNASGTSNVILNWSEKKDKAWEFLKWWTSDDIQYRFGVNVESVLGVSGRYASANLNANYRFGWDSDSLAELKKQNHNLDNIPEVPGSYYVSRSVQQVYWNVINNGQNVEDMLVKWAPEADDEIRRKTEEYSKK